MLRAVRGAQPGPAARRGGAAAVPRDHVGVPGAAGAAQGGVPRARRAPSRRPRCSSISVTRCGRCRCRSVDEVFHEVEAGNADFGVVRDRELDAKARSTNTLDRFLDLAAEDLRRGRAAHPSAPDGARCASLEGIERVCSHQQALAQCRAWLRGAPARASSGCRSRATPRARAARAMRRARRRSPGRPPPRSTGSTCSRARSRTAPTTPRASSCSGRKLLRPSGQDRTTLLVSVGDTRCSGRAASAARAARAPPRQHDAASSRGRRGGASGTTCSSSTSRGTPRTRTSPRRSQALEKRASLFRVLGSYPRAVPVSEASAGRDYPLDPGGSVQGELDVPGDKSISHRALMLGGIADGRDPHQRLPRRARTASRPLRALRALGVRIERPEPTRGASCTASGPAGLARPRAPLDMGNAGTAMRLSMGLLAGQPFASTLIGDASLMRRPMERVAAPLRPWARSIDTQDGRPPVRIARRRARCAASTTRCRWRARR